MKSANDLTQGVIWKQLVKYSLPLIATSVMQSLYSLFDILIAGRFLGSAGISGINNSSQVLGIVNTVVIGLSMGGTILIGRLFGQGEKQNAECKQYFYKFILYYGNYNVCCIVFCIADDYNTYENTGI